MTVLMAVGTRKGLWLGTSQDRVSWEWTGPHYPMTDVFAVGIDTRRETPRLLAGVRSEHFGPSVSTSDDLGATWQEPDHAPIAFPEDTGESLARAWQLAPGPASEPDVVYAGVEPSALFRSTDGGRTYELVRGLWDHPHREHWTHRGRRCFVGGEQHGDQGRPRTRPVPGVRPVRAQGRHASSGAGTVLRPGTPRRVPQRRRRRQLAVHRRRTAQRLRLPDGGAPAPARGDLHLPAGGRRHAVPAGGQVPGVPE